MQEHMPRNAFDIPAVPYFTFGNTHTGSRGHLRYRVKPADGVLQIEVWRKDLCYEIVKEKGEIEGAAEYPITKEGFQQMLEFLQTEFEK